MQEGKKTQALSLGTLLGALTSVVCMGSMGAMGVAAAATATAGMAGMGGVVGATRVAFITELLQNIGLGALTQIPDAALRPIFIILLLLGIVGTYFAYRVHRQIAPLILTTLASVLLYTAIYIMSWDPLYYVGLVMLLAGTVWNVLARRRKIVTFSPS